LVLFAALAFPILRWTTTRVARTTAYKNAIKIAESSPEVQQVLGSSIREASRASGTTSNAYGAQFAQWRVTLAGSHESGELYGVANAINGKWEYFRLTFVPATGSRKMDLTPPPSLLALPPVPQKRLYLIPVNLGSDESLDWAPAYYRAKLGIDVTVLPAMPAPEWLTDKRRSQRDAEKCIE